MKKIPLLFLWCLALCAFAAISASAQLQVQTIPFSVPQAATYSKNASITGSNQTITLGSNSTATGFTHVTIWTSSDAANLYVNPGGTTATSSNAIIYPGASLTVPSGPIEQVSILGASGAGTVNIVAN